MAYETAAFVARIPDDILAKDIDALISKLLTGWGNFDDDDLLELSRKWQELWKRHFSGETTRRTG